MRDTEQDCDSPEIVAISKLVEALVDHSASWMANRTDEPRVQAFFTVLLDLTGFPGTAAVDEDISPVNAHLACYD